MIDSIPIVRHRGQTSAFRITFTAAGSVVPLSGTVVLVVTQEAAPEAADVPIMTLTGTLIDSGENGVVEFEPTTLDADHVGEFYYEVQMEDSGGAIRPLLEGEFILVQDRAK